MRESEGILQPWPFFIGDCRPANASLYPNYGLPGPKERRLGHLAPRVNRPGSADPGPAANTGVTQNQIQ
jgi:hypothetical protein